MEHLRVLMLNHGYRETGSFFRCWNLARELVRMGHEVVLITVSPRRRVIPLDESADGLTVIESPNLLDIIYGLGAGYGVFGIPYRMLVAARKRFDLVHAFEHTPNVLLPAFLCRALSDCPLVADWSDWWGFTGDGSGLQERRRWPIADLENAAEELIHSKADRVTTVSSGFRDRALALGIPANRIHMIPSGAPTDVIRPLDRDSCRRVLGLPDSIYMLGFVSSGTRDLGMLDDALLTLRERQPRVRLGAIGPKPPFSHALTSKALEAVIPFGPVPFSQLDRYLGACDAFVLPLENNVYNRTRWPNRFGDYLAAGRPTLCSKVGDVAPIVEAEGCGIVWTDPSELIQGIESLMESQASADAMGAAARRLAEGRLSWRNLAAEFVAVYIRALGES